MMPEIQWLITSDILFSFYSKVEVDKMIEQVWFNDPFQNISSTYNWTIIIIKQTHYQDKKTQVLEETNIPPISRI